MCIDFRDLNKVCPKDFYPLPRINQLVDSTFGCELLSMMGASQGYHQIMLELRDHKRVSFITSDRTFSLLQPQPKEASPLPPQVLSPPFRLFTPILFLLQRDLPSLFSPSEGY
ncbi:UNVERIFIED_CONTAM: hypothetical protein Sangu_1026200 [Sesamum angustifolium]|uniref:Reverse transcriptase domain-containing protein n=1 Tax=Sesamum angustifolium TaxID=2727405 RepID=A0AAW2NWP1_9LAMI